MSWRDRATPVVDSNEAPPAPSWRQRATPVEEDPSALREIGGKLLEGAAVVGRAVDSVTGAPSRAAVRSLQTGGTPLDAAEAFGRQFAEAPEVAPTGKDIAMGFGEALKERGPNLSKLAAGAVLGPPALIAGDSGARAAGEVVTDERPIVGNVSPADVAGFAADVGTDWTNVVPGKAVASTIARRMGALAGRLDKFAKLRAAKQAGAATVGDYRRLARTGKLDPVGEFALDEGLVTPLSNVETVAERAASAKDKYGKMIGGFTDAVDDRFDDLARSQVRGELFNPARTADRIEKELLEGMRGSVAFDDLVPGLEKRVELLRNMGDGPIPFREAQRIKQDLDRLIPYKKASELTPAEQKLVELRRIVNEDIERAAEGVTRATTRPEAFNEFLEAKRRFGLSAEVDKMARDKVLRDQANRFVSATDYLSGGAALAGGLASDRGADETLAMTVGAAIANRLGRRYGNALASTGARKAANVARAAGRGVEAAAPAAQAAYVAGMGAQRSQNPSRTPDEIIRAAEGTEGAAAFAPMLRDASQRGPEAVKAAHFILMQTEPEYRRAFQGAPPE